MVKDKEIKVSVIIPVHNTEKYIGKCLDSLLGQTLEEIQVICVNDGSTDRSGEILKEYAGKDSRVTVMEQENKGQAAARNAAAERMEGEYCTFVDSDDWLEAEALEKLYARAAEEKLDVLYFAGRTEYDTEELAAKHDEYFDRAYRRDRIPGDVVSGREMLRRQTEAGQYWRSACMCLIRSRFLKEKGIRFREGIKYEDNLYAYLLCLRAERTACVPDLYYRRLLRENSTITAGRTARDLYGYITSVADEIALLEEAGGSPEDLAPYYTVIDETVKRAYPVWKGLEEKERREIDRYFRVEPCRVREGDLYHSLILALFRAEEERRARIEKEKQLVDELHKAIEGQRKLREDIREIYNSSSYRLGNALMKPVRKISGKQRPDRKPEGEK